MVADLSGKGVWLPQAKALLYICVVDIDAQSYLTHEPKLVLFRVKIENKRKKNFAAY